MTGIVVDASVALAWFFPDDASEYADGVLVALAGRKVIVPAVWVLEITNAVLVAERRKRVKQPDVRRFVELLGGPDNCRTITNGRRYGEQCSSSSAGIRSFGVRRGVP